MKKASSIMYLLSIIFSAISSISLICTGASGLIVGPNPTLLNELSTVFKITIDTHIYISIMTIILVMGIVIGALAIFSFFFKKKIDNDKDSLSMHITAIVLGAVVGTIFLLLGGVFGLIYLESKKNIVEDNKEE